MRFIVRTVRTRRRRVFGVLGNAVGEMPPDAAPLAECRRIAGCSTALSKDRGHDAEGLQAEASEAEQREGLAGLCRGDFGHIAKPLASVVGMESRTGLARRLVRSSVSRLSL